MTEGEFIGGLQRRGGPELCKALDEIRRQGYEIRVPLPILFVTERWWQRTIDQLWGIVTQARQQAQLHGPPAPRLSQPVADLPLARSAYAEDGTFMPAGCVDPCEGGRNDDGES